MEHGRKRHEGNFAGRDPREMTPDELREVGHQPMSPLHAVRARCLDCCAQQANAVARCSAMRCPSWPAWELTRGASLPAKRGGWRPVGL
jgi:hypothetical protein